MCVTNTKVVTNIYQSWRDLKLYLPAKSQVKEHKQANKHTHKHACMDDNRWKYYYHQQNRREKNFEGLWWAPNISCIFLLNFYSRICTNLNMTTMMMTILFWNSLLVCSFDVSCSRCCHCCTLLTRILFVSPFFSTLIHHSIFFYIYSISRILRICHFICLCHWKLFVSY